MPRALYQFAAVAVLVLLSCLTGSPSFAQDRSQDRSRDRIQDGSADRDRDDDRRIRVQLIAKQRATLSSNLAARISAVHVRLGGRFRKGDPLVTFDCRNLEAAKRRAQAEVNAAGASWRAKRRLLQLGAGGKLDLDLAAAALAKATASVQEIDVKLTDCRVTAPFDGKVASVRANAHETVSSGTALLDIVGAELEVRILVPSQWLRWMKAGSPFRVAVEETGKTYPAQVIAIGARVDTGSQRIEVIGRLTAPSANLLPGMSGAAVFSLPTAARK